MAGNSYVPSLTTRARCPIESCVAFAVRCHDAETVPVPTACNLQGPEHSIKCVHMLTSPVDSAAYQAAACKQGAEKQ
jgi:hypothetical protein